MTSLFPLFLCSCYLFLLFFILHSFLLFLLPPLPLLFYFLSLLCFLSRWSDWRAALSEAKPQLILPSQGQAVSHLLCGISNGFLLLSASWSRTLSVLNLKIQIKILKNIVSSSDRVLPLQKKGCSWNTCVAYTSPWCFCSLVPCLAPLTKKLCSMFSLNKYYTVKNKKRKKGEQENRHKHNPE